MEQTRVRKLDNGEGTSAHTVLFENICFETLSDIVIAQHTLKGIYPDPVATRYIYPVNMQVNEGVFSHQYLKQEFPTVGVVKQTSGLILTCNCNADGDKLCEHQAIVCSAMLKRDELLIFFDEKHRHEKLKKFAGDYGLQQEAELDTFFSIEYVNNTFIISPKLSAMVPVTSESMRSMASVIVPDAAPASFDEQQTVIVLKQHKYYKYLYVELYSAQTTKEGKIKNPLTLVAPLDLIWQTEDARQIKFFTGVHKFQGHLNKTMTDTDITALKAVVSNPLGYDFYRHDNELSDNVTAASVFPVRVGLLQNDAKLIVNPKDQFFELWGTLEIEHQVHDIKDLSIKYSCFVAWGDAFYLVNSLQQLNVITLLTKKQDNLLVHASKFDEFKKQLLTKLEEKVSVDYQYIPPATPVQLQQEGFTLQTEKIIYLSDFGAHVMIIPVMRYGEAEISIRTQKIIYATDKKGKEFRVDRDDNAEAAFMALLVKQHPYFEEQLTDELYYFYLHKKRFLNEDWFLSVFEEWQQHGVTILGFNELEGNKMNPNKVKITIKVLSGINWFNVLVNAKFGKQRAALKQVYRAVKNRTKYVQLDDGSTGILPAEWLAKFEGYFNSGEIGHDDSIQVAKSNFTVIEQLFDEAMLDEKVKNEISVYHQKLESFDAVTDIAVPAEFKGELRGYQQQGLNWLNFLDDFNFGGCLADDMGLGKTVQVIAFILSQRAKHPHTTNLVVVPTSLIYNWQQEIARFAPSIRVHTIYGAERIKNTSAFGHYEVVLTSYGTLLADIGFLKDHAFNYVILDESQQIKNPESQRYKAVRLLRSRNKLILTGTPVENNTFDIYGQLSFACPGLLGSRQYFKDIYSQPIDMFKSSKRAAELQKKISPFILRRTKQQVATDLPEKTEMVLYCDMKAEQRNIYDAYEKEFRDLISATTGDELKKTSMNVLKGITRLRQICDSPLLIKGEKMPGNASAKIDMLLEEIESKKGQHKLLVFSQFVEMLSLVKKELHDRGVKYAWLTGQTRNRRAVIEEFQNNEDVRVFLISLKAGGTGLNLTQADYVYLLDPWWNPAVENQAIDRCHRIGQDKNIVAVRLICPNTIEEKMMQLQENKRDLAAGLVTTDNSFFSSLSKADLLGLVT